MIKPLTSLRFVFALMVFSHHIGFVLAGEYDSLKWLYTNIFFEGFIGVNFFFILSGFVLAYNYQEKFVANRISKRNFFVARIARIYPLHLLTLLLAVPLYLKKIWFGNKLYWLIRFVANVALVQSYIPIKSVYLSFNRPAWSISDELFFYLLFPFLVLVIAKLLKENKYAWQLLLLGLLIIPLAMQLLPSKYFHALFYVHPFVRLADFIVGILVFNIFKNKKSTHINANFEILEFSAILLLGGFFMGHYWVPEVYRYSVYYWIPMAYLIYVFSFQKGTISKILSNRLLLLLGEISFSFYMFHYLVIDYFEILNQRYLGISNTYLMLFLIFSITLLLSYLSFLFFERPINQLIRTTFSRVEKRE